MDKKTWPPGISPSGRGLRVRITRGRKTIYDKTLPGDPHKASNIRAAVNHREALVARLKAGLPLYQHHSDNQAFGEVAQDYMDALDCKRSTSLSYENILNGCWMPLFGDIPAAEITTRAIKTALAKMPVSAKTKKNRLIPLKGVLDFAEVNPNPANTIRIKRTQKPLVQRYSIKERTALLAHLTGQERAYFALLFGCGLRPRGEPLALLWTDYDGEWLNVSKQITRRRVQESTKTSTRRKVYVPQWVRVILNDLPTRFRGEYIFVNSFGGPCLDADLFNAAWKKAHKKARIAYRIPYTCRHTRAAELLSTGVEPGDAAKQLGHSLEMFYRIYAEWIEGFSGKQDSARFEGLSAEALSRNNRPKRHNQ